VLRVRVVDDVEVIEAIEVEEVVEEAVEEVVVEEVVVVVVMEVVWLVVDDVEEVEITEEVVEVVEVLVLVMGPGKVKTVVANTVGGYPPQLALTTYSPEVQAVVPPATALKTYVPKLGSHGASPTTTTAPLGLITLIRTAVLGPGAGWTAPEMVIVSPEV